MLYITPIEDAVVDGVLPKRAEASRGLFAWGLPRLRSKRFVIALLELVLVFLGLPICAYMLGGALTLPVTMSVMSSSAIILLSATRSFHWSDLLPTDFWSEWRILLGGALACAGVAACATALFWPDRLFSPRPETLVMILGFPIFTALPLELACRALFFRRYGRLFQSETVAILFGGLATAMVYMVLAKNFEGAAFGGILGLALGWCYLRTGSFLLSVLLHWAAAAALFLIGPGLV